MIMRTHTAVLGGALLSVIPLAAMTQEADRPTAIRVCASTQDAPYSDASLEGFENRIAEVIAEEAGLELEMVMIDQAAIYLVRDGIEKGICDVIIGVDADDERLLTTEPYYKSGYAFISREDRGFEGERWQDVDQEGYNTFAYRYHTPAETILKYTGRYEYNLVYQASLTNFEDRRNKYTQVPAKLVVDEVESGKADLGILFAPEAARYVRDAREPLRMSLITNEIVRSDGVVIPLQYAQSVGISKDVPELLDPIGSALKTGRARIQAILEEEGIPTIPLS